MVKSFVRSLKHINKRLVSRTAERRDSDTHSDDTTGVLFMWERERMHARTQTLTHPPQVLLARIDEQNRDLLSSAIGTLHTRAAKLARFSYATSPGVSNT